MSQIEEKKIWGIHTQDDNLFLRNNVIAIGWRDMGDLRSIGDDRDAFKARYAEVYPNAKKGSVASGAGMLFRFLYEAQIGDYVVFPSKSNRQINIGTIESDYIYEENAHEYAQQRKVKWLKHLPRTSFSQGALYEIGSHQNARRQLVFVGDDVDAAVAAVGRYRRPVSHRLEQVGHEQLKVVAL